ncbi:MAG TPA: hypothetical protein VM737_02670 [Gemmatimonadota bacterium]|nr:hypothetical protein [Gemmatimonadota bacterium]
MNDSHGNEEGPTMDGHLTDDEILAWLDEPGEAGPPEHLAECLACRERAADTEKLLAALGADPPAIPEALAAQRGRVMAAVAARPRGSKVTAIRGPSIRRYGWMPLAAAAVIAGLLLLGRDATEPPAGGPAGTVTTRPEVLEAIDPAPLPVVAEADRAAEEAYAVEIDAALAALDPGPAVPTYAFGTGVLAEEFAALSVEDQNAILAEMSDMTFDL